MSLNSYQLRVGSDFDALIPPDMSLPGEERNSVIVMDSAGFEVAREEPNEETVGIGLVNRDERLGAVAKPTGKEPVAV